jgi:hypothetical protein
VAERLTLNGHLADLARRGVAGAARGTYAGERWAQAAWADCVMGEVHLHPDVARVDLLAAWALPAGEPARLAEVAAWVGGSPLLDAARGGGAWGAVPLVWFEWDDVDGSVRPPLEFVCVTDSILAGPVERGVELDARWFDEVVAWCGGDGVTVGEAGRVVRTLGREGALMHVATLAPRGLDAVRLGFQARADAVPGWLRRIGWPGDLDAVTALLARPGLAAQRVGVQLDLAPRLSGYLGLELPELRRGDGDREAAALLWAAAASVTPVDEARGALFRGWSGWEDDGGALRHTHLKLATVDGAWVAKAYLGRTTAAVAEAMRARGARGQRGVRLGPG